MAIGDISSGVGLRAVRVFVRDTDGAPRVEGSPAAGVAYNGIPISGAMALSLAVPAPQRITALGDDKPYHTFQLPSTENPGGELRVSKTNMDAVVLLTSTTKFGSAGALRIAFATDKVGEEESIMLWGSREAVDADESSADFGMRVWQTYFIFNAKVAVLPAAMEGGSVGEFVYSLVANPSTLDQFGDAFEEGVNGFTRASFLMMVTQHKYWIDVYVGAGDSDAYTLTKGSDLPAAGEGMMYVYVEGAAVAYTESGGVVTLDSSAGATDKVVIEYTYDD